jgi:hypothetical protein
MPIRYGSILLFNGRCGCDVYLLQMSLPAIEPHSRLPSEPWHECVGR